MITFKQFLAEGGKATEKYGTVRAKKSDIKSALRFVSKQTGVPLDTLTDRVLGSTRLTLGGHQADSGDIDIALSTKELDQDSVVEKMTFATGNKPHVTGGSTYSFAVPTGEDRKVQVDLMFVPDTEWAKFSHHASEHSAHKSGVRNELLHSALKFSMEDGKDVRVKDVDGNDVARASRAYKLDQGVERIFKAAPDRKDGKGRVKTSVKVSPAEVRKALDAIGDDSKFAETPDTITDPDQFAKLLFGPRAERKDLMSTERLITMIKKYKAKDADAIFKDAVKGITRLKFQVPDELKQFA
jgi:hypothetical protein